MMSGTLWGVSWPLNSDNEPNGGEERGHEGDLADFLEIQPGDCVRTLLKTKKSLRFSHWYLNGSDSFEQEEREEALFDLYKAHRALVGILSIPSRLANSPDLSGLAASLLRRASRNGVEIFFDFGKLGPPSGIDLNHCVFDPLWFRDRPWSRYWKIHGWHPERWVRRYSQGDLAQLVKQVAKHDPQFVVLAHSQRMIQLREIKKISAPKNLRLSGD